MKFCYDGGLRTSAISFKQLAVIFLQINFFLGLFVKQASGNPATMSIYFESDKNRTSHFNGFLAAC